MGSDTTSQNNDNLRTSFLPRISSAYRCEGSVSIGQSLETDRELDITGTDNVLDLEVCELCREAQLLDDTSVLARGQLGVVLRLCSRNDHFTGGKDQSSRLRVTNSHDHSSETLKGGHEARR